MARIAVAALALFIAYAAPASAPDFPPLTKDTIVGTWEALIGQRPLGMMLARLEISHDGPSFFAYQILGKPAANTINVFRVVSCDVTDEKISLHFHEISPSIGDDLDWYFEGTGQGDAQEGAMGGCLSGERGTCDNAHFLKASWTRWLVDRSREVEEGIARARREATK